MDKKSQQIICTAFANGKRHDFRLFKESKTQIHPAIVVVTDTGYQAVEEGLRSLSTLTLQEVTIKGQAPFQQIPEPRRQNKEMLEALGIELPKILSKSNIRVVTRKSRRKTVSTA